MVEMRGSDNVEGEIDMKKSKVNFILVLVL